MAKRVGNMRGVRVVVRVAIWKAELRRKEKA